MNDWHKWLAEMEERAQLVRIENGRCSSCIETGMMLKNSNLPRLIEGFRLMVEAFRLNEEVTRILEDADENMDDEQKAEFSKRLATAEERAVGAYDAALNFLRGVGCE